MQKELGDVRGEKEGLQKELGDSREESELLLLQLHQVQEELEHYFLQSRDLLVECRGKDEKLNWLRDQRESLLRMLGQQARLQQRFITLNARTALPSILLQLLPFRWPLRLDDATAGHIRINALLQSRGLLAGSGGIGAEPTGVPRTPGG